MNTGRTATRGIVPLALAAALGWACEAEAGGDQTTFYDAVGDAAARRTDPGADDPIGINAVLPDLVSLTLDAWQANNAVVDPYAGVVVRARDAHLFRLDLVLNGLVNPPGPIGVWADPFMFGPSPLYGFIDLDVDRDKDTGGELGPAALNRYLANVGRFGQLPRGSFGTRAAQRGTTNDFDGDFFTGAQYERSGEDFALVLCGCFTPTIVSEGGDGDSIFEAGETWVVRGRFFQRAAGYRLASGVFGGSDFGLYDPVVNLRFSHDVGTNRTTVTLVYALDMQGAAALSGQPQQPMDQVIDIGGNHSSVREALADLILGASGQNGGPLAGPTRVLTERWENEDSEDFLDPSNWSVTALVATACQTGYDSLLAWTDVGFSEKFGDFDCDGVTGALDATALVNAIDGLDGGPLDADGQVDGVVHLVEFAGFFSVYDLNYDGMVGQADLHLLAPPCPADWNHSGSVTVQDLFDFINSFFTGSADFNGSDSTSVQDLFDFIGAFLAGCP